MLFDHAAEKKKKKLSTISILKDLWRFLKPLRNDIWIALFMAFLLQGFAVLQPVFWKQMIDGILHGSSMGFFVKIFIILILFTIVQNIVLMFRGRQGHHFQWKSRLLLEEGGFDKLLKFSIGQHIEQGSGIKFATYQTGVNGFTSIAQQLVYDVFPSVFTLLLTLTVLFFISWELALALSFAIVVRLWADIAYARKYIKEPSKKMHTTITARWAHMKEVTREIETVKQFGKEDFESNWLHQKFIDLRNLSNAIWLRAMTMQAARNISFNVFYYALILVAVYFIFQGRFTPGYIILFTTWGGMVTSAVNQLTSFERNFIDNMVNSEKLLEMLRKEPAIQDTDTVKIPEKIEGHILFKKMNFFYKEALEKLRDKDDEKNVKDFSVPLFQEFTLDIPEGKTTALVGHSGSGKSTLVKLLQRYYDVTGGQILFDDVDIRELSQKFLRNQIGIVPQDVRLFDGTLRENLVYGLENPEQVSEDNLIKVMNMACIDKFFDRLPNGLETEIGENGIKLSGGEKQRVGIARALLKDPTVLIFDEATSSLDSENEKLIQKAVKDVSQGRTTIIVAHRLSTIIHADKIVVLEKGKIVGEGTHKELMKTCVQYKKLVTIQMKDLLLSQMGEVTEEEVNLVLKDLSII